jgi:hypothetical protein
MNQLTKKGLASAGVLVALTFASFASAAGQSFNGVCIFSELVTKNHSVIAQFDGLSHLPRLCTFNFILGPTGPKIKKRR